MMTFQDGPLAEALGAWKAEPKMTYQALQKPLSDKNEERVKQQASDADHFSLHFTQCSISLFRGQESSGRATWLTFGM